MPAPQKNINLLQNVFSSRYSTVWDAENISNVFECAIIVFVVVSQKAPALPLPFRGGLSLYAKEAVP